MRHYLDAGNLDRLYDESGDLFDEGGTPDYDEISSRFLGRTMATLLNDSGSIQNKVKHILNRETNTDDFKSLIQSIVISRSFPQYSYKQVTGLFLKLYQGLLEKK